MASVRDIAPPWLRFIPASEWGIIWKRPPIREGLADPETYIHHGAGGRWGTDPIAAMRALQKWYHDVKNYSTIGYDMMVHRNTMDDTVAICGAREGWLSAATLDRNDLGEAICLFGYFHPGHPLSEHPTARELEALAFAVALSIEEGWSAPDTQVLGHRQNPAHPGETGCPGDNLFPFVPSIGRRALELLAIANNLEEDMRTLPKPDRVYDSRDKDGPLGPGQSRVVTIGAPDMTEAMINLVAIGRNLAPGAAGYLSVNDTSASTSVVGYSSDDRIENNGTPCVAPKGQITVTNTGGTADFAIDVTAAKP